MNKKRISLFLSMLILLTSFASFAQGDQEVQISPWAYGELIDAERMGIYGLDYYKDNFTKDITKDKAEAILKNVDEKFKAEGLDEVKVKAKDLKDIKDITTRDGFLKSLHNLGLKYNLVDLDKTYLEYFQANKILTGGKNGLELERKVTTEEAVIFAKRFILKTFEDKGLGSRGIMWKTSKNGKNVYLLGSIHMGNSSLYPMNTYMMDAFTGSKELHVELDLLEPNVGSEMVNKMYYTDGTTLKSAVGEESYKKTLEVLGRYGIAEDVVKNMKPWAVVLQLSSITLMTDENDGADSVLHGVDMYFLTKAKNENKKIVEMEGMNFQLKLFDDLSLDKQKLLLDETVNGLLELKEEDKQAPKDHLDTMLKAWKAGDKEGLKGTLGMEKESEINNLLLGSRDRGMAEKIVHILESEEVKAGDYFVVVGAAHYLTDGAVVDILRDKGYIVEDIK